MDGPRREGGINGHRLVAMTVEVYTEPTGPAAAPTYRARRDFGPDDAVPLVIDGAEIARIAARELLP